MRFEELSASVFGRDVTLDFIGPLRQPRDRLMRLQGGDLGLYAPVFSDDRVKSVMQQRILAVVSREWSVEPGEESRAGRKAADWLRETLERLDFDRISEQMLWGVFWGYSVAELILKPGRSFVELEDIRPRDRRRFAFGMEGDLRLLTRANAWEGEAMPPERFWVFSSAADHHDDPYGLGLAHWLYWPVFFKRAGLKFWARGIEKFAIPTIVGKYPAGTTEEQKGLLREALEALISESVVTIPENMAADLLTSAQAAAGLGQEALYRAMNGAISTVVLSQTMTTEDGSSLSQAEVHERVAQAVVRADADLVCKSLSRSLRWLAARNFGAKPPLVWRRLEDEEDLGVVAERDSKLHAMGWSRTEESLRETYGEGYERRASAAPVPPDPEASPLPGAPPAPKPQGGEQGAAEEAEEAEAFAASDPEGDSIGDLTKALIEGGQARAAAAPLLDPIAEALTQATDLEALDAMLDALAKEPPEAGRMAELLARGAFAARLAGETGAPMRDGEEGGGHGAV